MNAQKDSPVLKELVLLGGGHSHLAVLMHLAMHPLPGLQITLITRDLHTPYSGMLPGYIAGHYHYDETHIDLRPLAQFAGARIFHSAAVAIDPDEQRVHCDNRPPVPYDLLSINIGSRPTTLHVAGAAQYAIPVKPIDRFLQQWHELQTSIRQTRGHYRLAVVGGGAGGVEMALASQYRLQQVIRDSGSAAQLDVGLYCDSHEILPGHNKRVRRFFSRLLAQRNIEVFSDHRVSAIEAAMIHCENGQRHHADTVFWVTNASAPDWLRQSGITVDDDGFILVNDCLQSTSHDNIFAAGDIATMQRYQRPKSGVFAVRQGMPLARNLLRRLQGRPLKAYRPQKNFLSLISTGNRFAVASRGELALAGGWLWRVKDAIDRRFMDKFNRLPEMNDAASIPLDNRIGDEDSLQALSSLAMRCGGCGAKVGSRVLSRVINRLEPVQRNDVLIGLNTPDDAAVIEVPAGKVLVQSVDYFRRFLDDPYVFGQIAANHALSDLFAMGAEAQSAMAIATVPFGLEKQIEEQLFQTMSGTLTTLNACQCALVGGHSSEGSELAFGLAVSGLVEKEKILHKTGMQAGDCLIVTKPLGTGILFAADMRRKARGRWIDQAIQHMLQSNRQAAACLYRHQAHACTDVTGFGLLGHLVEMTRASGQTVRLELETLPVMEGAPDLLKQGIFSTLQEQNLRLRRAIRNRDAFRHHPLYPMLFDPQTSGGLLAAIPQAQATACLQALHELGYHTSRVIGTVEGSDDRLESIILK